MNHYLRPGVSGVHVVEDGTTRVVCAWDTAEPATYRMEVTCAGQPVAVIGVAPGAAQDLADHILEEMPPGNGDDGAFRGADAAYDGLLDAGLLE